MNCPRCGRETSGSFCANCGTPLERDGSRRCDSCGAPYAGGALYCGECGEPVRPRPEKSLGDQVPWILSGLGLLAFAVGITLLVQSQSAPRAPGEPPTGGVLSGGGGRMAEESPGRDGGGVDGETAGPPTAEELAAMPPREAADRLYERAMSLRESGEDERAVFFAGMGVEAYDRVPAADRDADLRFHLGLLHLLLDEPGAARSEADAILEEAPGDLLGLALAVRAARTAGDTGRAANLARSYLAAFEEADLTSRPDYRAHRSLLEAEADRMPDR